MIPYKELKETTMNNYTPPPTKKKSKNIFRQMKMETTHKNLLVATKTILRQKFIVINAYNKKKWKMKDIK